MHYSIHKKINSGGMADLFLATCDGANGFRRACALKIVRDALARDADSLSMFQSEASIGASLQHQNIVSVSDVTTVNGQSAIVMELILGTDLEDLLRTCNVQGAMVPVPMIVYICAEAARGLHHAHQRRDPATDQPLGIIHRDVSPGNILISEEGLVKVSDFGIAKVINRQHETMVGTIKGKLSYISPEQVQGGPITFSIDIFALGVVLWEALAGIRRFAGLDETTVLKRLTAPPELPYLLSFNSNVEEHLDSLVQQAVAPDPSRRFASAGEFAKALDVYLRTYHPNFTANKLAVLMRRAMKDKIESLRKDVKQALSQPSDELAERRAATWQETGTGKPSSAARTAPNTGAPQIQAAVSAVPRPSSAAVTPVIVQAVLQNQADVAGQALYSRGRDLTLVGSMPESSIRNLDRGISPLEPFRAHVVARRSPPASHSGPAPIGRLVAVLTLALLSVVVAILYVKYANEGFW